MKIRSFSQADIDSCVDLFIRVFNQEPWNDEWSRDYAGHYLNDYVNASGFGGYIAEDEEGIKGFIMGIRKKWWSGDEFFINEMCVDTSCQRSGIGSQLINIVHEDMQSRGISRITLLTNRGIPAEDFYKKHGFVEIERLIFMNKEL
ncbi:GNAT family N-acetyltransferase [Paenibacillus sp. YPG26]|uniref:GNAT family N-acetyltransferase n=1 Tax=Paenibacillus sp. YPG26 TaxID=2878915 RepID=UPI002041FCB9|nr:GNAT family N-acetyltransferase [Paenibacillus sp. YPG26]USB31655.1 GNAT family N-acetyltransferase [Paenibacillus sp. YPG26]